MLCASFVCDIVVVLDEATIVTKNRDLKMTCSYEAIYTYKQLNVYRRDRWPAMVSWMKKKVEKVSDRNWYVIMQSNVEKRIGRRAHRKKITEILYEMMNGEKCINNLSSLACHFMIILFKFFSPPLRFTVLFCLHLGLVLLLILSTAIHHINKSLLLKVSIMLIEQSH